jgi:hypothetical protein
MDKLSELLNELESKIPKQELINQTISKSSVGWHIEHTLLTINLIIRALKKSNQNDYKWKFNFPRVLVFSMNNIPRGGAKSPKAVQPKNNFNTESLKNHINIATERIKELSSLKKDNFFEHPVFGNLNLKPTIKFLEIHTNHHIKIINDIIKNAN